MTKRIEELASLFEDQVGREDNKLQALAVDFKAESDGQKYQEYLDRAGNGDWYDLKLLNKEAGSRKGNKVSKKHLLKQISQATDNYKNLRKELSSLEAEMDALDNKIKSARSGMYDSRADMLRLNGILQNMDLVDSQSVVMYDNDNQDVGYLIDKEEHHLSVDDAGNPSITSMKDYFRSLRQPKQEDSLEDSANVDLIPGIARLEDPVPRTEEQSYESHPNLRFLE